MKLTNTVTPVGRLAFNINDVVRLTGLSRSTVYNEISEGRLRIRKIGRRTIILREDLAEFLGANLAALASAS